jgi:hypothetical protein
MSKYCTPKSHSGLNSARRIRRAPVGLHLSVCASPRAARRSGAKPSRLLDRWPGTLGGRVDATVSVQSALARTPKNLTATIIFLVGDLANWSATVEERRRLAGVLVSLFAGATAGGLLLVRAQIYAPVLPFVITLAAVATAAIVLRGRDAVEEQERD